MEKFKVDVCIQDILVYFLFGKDECKKVFDLGVIDFFVKLVSQEQMFSVFVKIEIVIEINVWCLLVVEDSVIQYESICELFDQKGVQIIVVISGEVVFKVFGDIVYDCMILDLILLDMSGFELLECLYGNDDYEVVLVVIYIGKDLICDEEVWLCKYVDCIIFKIECFYEWLFNEVFLFLYWLEFILFVYWCGNLELIEYCDDIFEGKKLLLVDDDMCNIYVLFV